MLHSFGNKSGANQTAITVIHCSGNLGDEQKVALKPTESSFTGLSWK
jgi:hypothetical protein